MSNASSDRISRRGRAVTDRSATDSRERLLQAAIDLLAESGLEDFRVLEVAARARANVALINYHFGGRDGLLDEVIKREAIQVSAARETRLQGLLESAAPGLPTVDAVIRCWIEPMAAAISAPGGLGPFRTMIHLLFAADVSDERKSAQLQPAVEVTAAYLDVLERILPGLDRHTLSWRMLCAIGSCYLVLGQAEPVGWSTLSGTRRAAKVRHKDAIDALVTFVVAGISAPRQAPKRSVRSAEAKRRRSG